MRTLRLVIDGDLIYLFLQTVKTILGERVKTVNLIKQKAFDSGDGIVDPLEDDLVVLSDGIVDSSENDLIVLSNRRGRKIFCVYGEKSSLIRTRYV